jgi:hypothetical protein
MDAMQKAKPPDISSSDERNSPESNTTRIQIRVRLNLPLQKHCTAQAAKHTGSVPPEQQQRASIILGAPVKPDGGWFCDTDLVWPVLGIEGVTAEYKLLEQPYVCRHNFIAGD